MSDETTATGIPAPTIEPPKAEAVKPEAKQAGEIDYSELVSNLEKAGITSAKQLDGKLQAASERGYLANLLGERNREISEMKAMLAEMQKMQSKAGQNSFDEPTQAGAIDIGDLIKKQIKSAISEEKQQALEMQQRAYQAWQQIQSDEDYHLVADKWEARLRDPNFAVRLQAGAVNPVDEYQKLLRNHYKDAVRLAATTIKSLTQGVAPPKVHVEDTARVSGSARPDPTEKDKTINDLRGKVNTGKHLSEEEELAALQAVLLGGARR